MEQSSVFHNSFDMDYFPSVRMSGSLAFPDAFDVSARKASINFFDTNALGFKAPSHHDHYEHHRNDNMSLLPSHKEDEMAHDHAGAFKAHQVQNFLDSGLESYFGMKDRDFGFDSFQVRSRGGSFNFGHLRKESEDLFHMNSDIFKHIRNITDNNHPIEALSNKAGHHGLLHESHHSDFYHNNAYGVQNRINNNIQLREIAGNIQENLSTTVSQSSHANIASNHLSEDSTTQGAKKRGRKKRMLNDKTEDFTEEQNTPKKPAKLGRPKKDAKSNESNFDKMLIKREISSIDEKATDISSNASKCENSPVNKPKTDIMTDLMRLNAPTNIKDLLHGTNMPLDVKEFIRNSNLMDKNEWLDARRIGTLTVAERRAKIEKYLAKRRLRTSSRKVNYDCRKRVADSRLRIKGRFVTRIQAFALLDAANIPYNAENITNLEIKALLTESNGSNALKRLGAEFINSILNAKRPADESDHLEAFNYGEYEA